MASHFLPCAGLPRLENLLQPFDLLLGLALVLFEGGAELI
jgi:hypothetical protein